MHRLVPLALLLTGCPPPPRYAAFEVRDRAPLADAVVAAECGGHGTAQRTDDTGFARLRLAASPRAQACVVTVAKPGHRTIETGGAALCTSPTACPVLVIDLPASEVRP